MVRCGYVLLLDGQVEEIYHLDNMPKRGPDDATNADVAPAPEHNDT